MDELLNEYIQNENGNGNGNENENENEKLLLSANNVRQDNANDEVKDYDDYIQRTKEYYYKMSYRELLSALWFTMSSCFIGVSEYFKYYVGWKSRNKAIMDMSKRLAVKNMMYVKVFQAFATNRNIVSQELNDFFSNYTDNVAYTDDEYQVNELKELEEKSCTCWPYQQLRIINDYKPIKSGLMSLIFKGYIGEGDTTPVVIKYLRKNIEKNFTASMNNLVVFAKITKYFPYMRTLNVENLILQNIVSLKDQVCFKKELTNIRTYYNSWKDYPYVSIPKPYSDYTEQVNPDVIVMEFIHGIGITDIAPEDNDAFARVLAAFNAKAAFCTSIFHGDLHPGNILFIKSDTTPTHKIGILDFGIIGHLSRNDQEILFNVTKYTYQRKFDKIVQLIMSCEISEFINADDDKAHKMFPERNSEKYETIRREITRVLIEFTTPQIKFFGVKEIYEINYILNKYGLMFKRTLYRLFITAAIMDSIGTRLGSNMSFIEHTADIVIDMFKIKSEDSDATKESESTVTEEEEGEEEGEEEEGEEEEEEDSGEK